LYLVSMFSMSTKRLRVLIKGQTPAGFKPQVRVHAVKRGLKGFCAETPDKSAIEIVAEGPEPALKQFLEQDIPAVLKGAKVEMTVEWGEPTGKYKSFRLDRYEEEMA